MTLVSVICFLLVYVPLLLGLAARSRKKEEHSVKIFAFDAFVLALLVFAPSYLGITPRVFAVIGVIAKWLGYIALEIGIIVLAVRLSGIPFSEMGDRLADYLERVDRDARKMKYEKMMKKRQSHLAEDGPAPESTGSVK